MNGRIYLLCIVLSVMMCVGTVYAVVDSYEFKTPEQEQRFFRLINELRCPQCQNQSIADSNALIAHNLRREVYRLLNEGADNEAVVAFMLARYGDFILYKPRLSGINIVLWIGPLLILLVGMMVLIFVVRSHKNNRMESVQSVLDTQVQEVVNEQLDHRANPFHTSCLNKRLAKNNSDGYGR